MIKAENRNFVIEGEENEIATEMSFLLAHLYETISKKHGSHYAECVLKAIILTAFQSIGMEDAYFEFVGDLKNMVVNE